MIDTQHTNENLTVHFQDINTIIRRPITSMNTNRHPRHQDGW